MGLEEEAKRVLAAAAAVPPPYVVDWNNLRVYQHALEFAEICRKYDYPATVFFELTGQKKHPFRNYSTNVFAARGSGWLIFNTNADGWTNPVCLVTTEGSILSSLGIELNMLDNPERVVERYGSMWPRMSGKSIVVVNKNAPTPEAPEDYQYSPIKLAAALVIGSAPNHLIVGRG
ncbi:hypothetical protein [Microbacterium paulum]